MVEHPVRILAPEAAGSLFSSSASGADVQDKRNCSISHDGKPNDAKEDNNQEDEGCAEGSASCRDESQTCQELRTKNSTLLKRLSVIEVHHAERVNNLEKKLQEAIDSHREIEQRLKCELQSVQDKQREAAENARKIRTILLRVSRWMRHVQRAAQVERPHLDAATLGDDHNLENNLTPSSEAPYSLLTDGKSLAATDPECQESSAVAVPPVPQYFWQWSTPDVCEIPIEGTGESRPSSLPPLAPGRNRVKNVAGKGFNYAAYNVASPPNLPKEAVLDVPSEFRISSENVPSAYAPRSGTAPKRAAGSLLSYCAQVVTTSLVGVRLSPSFRDKMPGYLTPEREERQIDEEAGLCSDPPLNQSQRSSMTFPNLSIGLL